MFARQIGIDLGTVSVLVYVKGRGVVLQEPSVVAIRIKDQHIVEIGERARQMLGRTPETIEVVRPLKGGVIADYTVRLACPSIRRRATWCSILVVEPAKPL